MAVGITSDDGRCAPHARHVAETLTSVQYESSPHYCERSAACVNIMIIKATRYVCVAIMVRKQYSLAAYDK